MGAIHGAATDFLPWEYPPYGISPIGILPIRLRWVNLGNLDYQGSSHKVNLQKERFKCLRAGQADFHRAPELFAWALSIIQWLAFTHRVAGNELTFRLGR